MEKAKRKRACKFTRPIEDEIIKLYQGGDKVSFLTKKFNCSRMAIDGLFARNGIKLRERGYDHRKHFFNFNYFNNIDSHDKAQVLGLFAADGNVAKREPLVSISLPKDVISIRRRIKLGESNVSLAKEFGVCADHISKIKRFKIWSNLNEDSIEFYNQFE